MFGNLFAFFVVRHVCFLGFRVGVWVCRAPAREQVYRTFKATTYKIQADDDQDLSEPCALDYAQLNDLRRILSYWAVMGYTDRYTYTQSSHAVAPVMEIFSTF